MNMEPDPLDFSVLNNSLRTDWSTKGPAQKANQIVLSFSRVSPRGLIPITPSGRIGNNRAHIREYSPFLRDRAILTRQLRPCLEKRCLAEPLSLD